MRLCHGIETSNEQSYRVHIHTFPRPVTSIFQFPNIFDLFDPKLGGITSYKDVTLPDPAILHSLESPLRGKANHVHCNCKSF